MQNRIVEARVAKKERQAVALNEVEIKLALSPCCTTQHCGGKIKPYVSMTDRHMRQVETGADAVQQNVAMSGLGQL
jgi:hypothetical protein